MDSNATNYDPLANTDDVHANLKKILQENQTIQQLQRSVVFIKKPSITTKMLKLMMEAALMQV